MPEPVDYYFDYASPWAYLADTLLARKLPGVVLEYKPTYLRGLESFATALPYTSNKLRYITEDLQRCVAYERVALAGPADFPVNGLYALRGALVAQEMGGFERYHRAMFAAVWAESRPVGTRDAVVAIAAEHGFEPRSFAAAMDSPGVKERLKSDTASAQERGVFGVPTFIVGEQMFWGHDRLEYLARALGVEAPPRS